MTPKEQTPDAQPQNYICLNCKLVLNHEPKQCPECRHQFFHKTDAHECEHFLMTDVAVYACDCDNIQIVDVKDGYTTEYVPKDQPSTYKPESGVSDEDARRIVEWVDRNYQRNNVWEFAYKAAEYEHRYMATKQAELVEERDRFREALEEIDKYYRIAESNDDFAMEAIQTVIAALTKTPKP